MSITSSITAEQRETLQALIIDDDRVASYLKLNEFTGSKSALLMAQISSSSGVIGGTAWAINTAYQSALPGYPEGGVAIFSREIALADFNLISSVPNSTGRFDVPSDQGMLIGAFNVWQDNYGLGFAFPGNAAIAYNYIAAGEFSLAAPFLGYAALTAPIIAPLFVGERFWEAFDSPYNSGKSLEEFLANNPGASAHTTNNGEVTYIMGADGKTLGAFVNSQLDTLPLTGFSELNRYLSQLDESAAYTTVDGDVQTRHYSNGVQVETSTRAYESIEYGAVRVGSEFIPYSMMVTCPDSGGGVAIQYVGQAGTVTSIDGQVTRYEATRMNGDRTSTDYYANGEVCRITDTDGARDNADYATRTTTYDAQGRTDWIEMTQSDGGSDKYYYDVEGSQSWNVFATHRDALGRQEYSLLYQDDGSIDRTDHDVDGSQDWSRKEARWDAWGRQDYLNVFQDDGSSDRTDFDQDGWQDWAVSVSHFDAWGRQASADMYNRDGSTTRFDYDAGNWGDWSTTETRFDTWGRREYSVVFQDDGSIERTDHDFDGSQGWSRKEARWDTWGRQDHSTVFHDDGSSDKTDFNQDGSQDWSVLVSHFDALGRQASADVYHYDGSTARLDFDETEAWLWSSIETRFDALGRNDYINIVRDDGSIDRTEYDQDSSQSWSIQESRWDALGRQDYFGVTHDDGSVDWTDLDQANERNDSFWEQRTDALGRADWQRIQYDDGRREVVDFDETNANALSSSRHTYDVHGRETDFTNFYDDGGRLVVDIDETGIQRWSSFLNAFDAQGRLSSSNELLRDGRRFEINYDEAGGNSWSSCHTVYDANGNKDYATRFYDDGRRLELDYDGNGIGNTRMIAYRPDGTVCLDGTLYANGTVMGVGPWMADYGTNLHVTNIGGVAAIYPPASTIWPSWTPPSSVPVYTQPGSEPTPPPPEYQGRIEVFFPQEDGSLIQL